METPEEIPELVARFGEHIDEYRDGTYNETQVRREFIDPLFGALGWDVNNERGWAEAYKEVIHEDAIKVGGATKAPDYCFRIGGVRKFFVEAKKPSVNVKHEVHPACRLREQRQGDRDARSEDLSDASVGRMIMHTHLLNGDQRSRDAHRS